MYLVTFFNSPCLTFECLLIRGAGTYGIIAPMEHLSVPNEMSSITTLRLLVLRSVSVPKVV